MFSEQQAAENAAVRADQKKFGMIATAVAVATFVTGTVLLHMHGHPWLNAALTALVGSAIMRGLVDLGYRRLTPIPSLFGTDDESLRTENALHRRRIAFWKHKVKLLPLWIVLFWQWDAITGLLHNPGALLQMIMIPFLFLINFAILMGPLMLMGIMQMKGLEPGDADFGVKLADVRGQKEAKHEIQKVVNLWEAGEHFAKAGGKRERGVLFLGAPGVGKTMLAKAIATSFNSPIVLMPGSAFAQTFIGMDSIIVRWLYRKAKKLAAKWGGSCIVFIDEIDAVGMRRNTLGQPQQAMTQMPGGMMGGMGMMGLNSLLVVMDSIDSPPWFRKTLVNKVNLWMDAFYIFPTRFRLPKAKPDANQVYWVGATNVPLEALDPALTRPGRMGRHVYFRTPVKQDRMDIFDMYLTKIATEPELDTEDAREELARLTGGYSPAMIEQVCNLALMNAQHDGRFSANRQDVVDAMVGIEMGSAIGHGYDSPEEELSTARHEAGHAIAVFLYDTQHKITRMSVKLRGATGGHVSYVEELERFGQTREELFASLIVALASHAAEMAFYGHNTNGVGGDLQFVSHRVGLMVGRWGMAPFFPPEADAEKLEQIGMALLDAPLPTDVKLPPQKVKQEALLIGHAYVVAHAMIKANFDAADKIANEMFAQKEIFGNDALRLMESMSLVEPEIDWTNPDTYPTL